MSNSNDENSELNSSLPKPKQKDACSGCVGYIKNCNTCGQKIEILNGKPLDYHAGTYHRCPGRPRY